jgi:hypothetical protein
MQTDGLTAFEEEGATRKEKDDSRRSSFKFFATGPGVEF